MKQTFHPKKEDILVNIDGELLPRAEAKISVFDSLVQGGDGCWEGLRVYGGRIFRLDEGVWMDTDHADGDDTVRIQAFSEAYFRVLEALPELRAVLRELDAVVVSGRDVSIRVDDEGEERIGDRALRQLVRRFRENQGAP